MSGFSADWLALREPADHAARSRALLDELCAHLARRDSVRVVDLGCGTGSNLRAMAAFLPKRQHWRLVDHDPALLARARGVLAAWADRSASADGELRLAKAGREITVSFMAADLAGDIEAVLTGPADLISAAAFFDLVSSPWIRRLALLAAGRDAAFYAALNYDGAETWLPAHPADAQMLAAFHAHQQRDKGFGVSAGPRSGAVLAETFGRLGYAVREAASPWRLGPGEQALVAAIARGIASAVAETGLVPASVVRDWLARRLEGAACRIGHTDLLALPAGR
jgi:SAM-dependent methyltransferase